MAMSHCGWNDLPYLCVSYIFLSFWMIQTQHPHVFFQSPRKPAVDEAARAEGALFFVVKIVRTSKLGLFCGDNNPPSFGGSTMLNSYLLMDQTVISLWLPTQKGHVYMFTDEIQCPFGHGAWWVDDTPMKPNMDAQRRLCPLLDVSSNRTYMVVCVGTGGVLIKIFVSSQSQTWYPCCFGHVRFLQAHLFISQLQKIPLWPWRVKLSWQKA